MNKLIKTALLASALGILSVNAYAATLGEGDWTGETGISARGHTPEEACINSVTKMIERSIPSYKDRHYLYTTMGDLRGNNPKWIATCWAYTQVPGDKYKSNFNMNVYNYKLKAELNK
ncbi:hypothetical protein DKL61_04660 [Gammaproteobacteria bacterium ESL0073]|nr:hypothetical protein DKL61_04660 [Gammaproteobacteria bacterium ESL0073]